MHLPSLTTKDRLLRWLPLLFWLALIFLFSHQPKTNLEPAQPSAFFTPSDFYWRTLMGVDWDTVAGKSAHIAVFGILAWLIWRVYPNLQVVLWGTVLYGFLDEFHQLFIPGCTGRLLDVMFDCLGAILAVWWLWRREAEAKAT